uniref:SCP domain-containing protein n=1 Tax=Mesocestoides corti TaxID=53468 RepID=A0A5K3EP54_MESCO
MRELTRFTAGELNTNSLKAAAGQWTTEHRRNECHERMSPRVWTSTTHWEMEPKL